jgi:Tfp pilus assembly protein PilF
VSNAHWRLGQIYEKTSRRDLAKAEYNEALKMNPQNRNAKKSLEDLK